MYAKAYICIMNYKAQHLRDWLNAHNIISISKLESVCKIPKDTIRHFKEERRNIPDKHLEKIENQLSLYGYLPLNKE